MKLCSKCHQPKSRRSFPPRGGARCQDCLTKSHREWVENNRERERLINRRYYYKHHEKRKARSRVQYWRNVEVNRARHRAYYFLNRKPLSAKKKIYYQKNKPKFILNVLAWSKNNPELVKQYRHRANRNQISRLTDAVVRARLRSEGVFHPSAAQIESKRRKILHTRSHKQFAMLNAAKALAI